MTDAQARRFARDWRVVDQYTHTEQTPIYDDGGNITGYLTTSNGLTVTVFQEIATGKRHLAIRGTEATSGADLWTDFRDLVAIGTPEHQSQYQSLKAKIDQWLADPAVLQGRTFTVAGHSLGGFLAAAVAIDFALDVEHAYLYNAPGAGGVRANLEQAIQTLNGLPYGSRTLDLGIVSNLRAASGASLIAGLGEAWSTPLGIEIEAASGLGLGNHSIVRLTDALAIHAAYAELAPALTLAQTGQILRSASERNANSLEAMLDALRKTLLGAGVTVTPEENRDALYGNLHDLQASAAYQGLKGGAVVKLTAVQDHDTLVTNAKSDFGAFLAVKYLLPVVIEGSWAVLSTIHTDLHAQWQADRTNRTAGNIDLNFTDEYLADRSAFLTWKNHLALRDRSAAAAPYTDAPDAFFRDYATSLTIHLGATLIDSTAKPRFIFGTDQASGVEMLEGGTNADRIYGGGGADILNGGAGADRLEGNGGDDTLVGGAGGDFLVGGAGDDTYVIVTGESNDTIEDGDGAGAIELDGARLDGGTALAPGVWVRGGTTYHFEAGADGRGELLIRQGAETVRVERFRDGDLGIVLEGEEALAGAAPLTEAADHIGPAQNPAPGLDGLGGNDVLVSHELSAALLGGGGGDLLFGGAGADRLEGGAGGDYLNGGAGADLILGGAGDDLASYGNERDVDLAALHLTRWEDAAGGWGWRRGAMAYVGETDRLTLSVEVTIGGQPARFELAGGPLDDGDTVYGGPGDDVLAGNEGADALYGEEDSDWLKGNGGADLLDGGDGDDLLLGDDGEDCLDGAAGADRLYGGYEADSLRGGAGNDLLVGDLPNLDGTQAPPASADPLRYGADALDGGAGDDELHGGGGADTLDGGEGADRLYGGGHDDLLAGGAGDDRLDGDAGAQPWGNDTLFGEDGQDVLIGAGGADRLYGGEDDDELHGDAENVAPADQGADWLYGGAGNDYLRGYAGNDAIEGEEGDDELHGDDGDDSLAGGAGANALFGEAGNDTLAALGADYLAGGAGDDMYVIDTANATVLDLEGANRIRLVRAASMDEVALAWDDLGLVLRYDGNLLLLRDMTPGALPTLEAGDGSSYDPAAVAAHIGLTLTGTSGADTLYGGAGNDSLFGLEGMDSLYGGGGDDFLDGGRDLNTLAGGSGDDTYRVSYLQWGQGNLSMSDSVVELAGEGDDSILGYSYSVILPDNVERLRLEPIDWSYSNASTGQVYARQGRGNAGDNVLDASGQSPMPVPVELDGRGGRDLMIGSDHGNTTFWVDDSGDQVVAAGPDNTVRSWIDYRLGAGLRNLILDGANPVAGIGNAGDNDLGGDLNAAANRLSGGAGNDRYILGAGDAAIENAGEGNDTVRIAGGPAGLFRLADFPNIENLELGDGLPGGDLEGDDQDNRLAGNIYDNHLVGGAGNDMLFDGWAVTLWSGDVDVLEGGAGDDFLKSYNASDVLIGGTGNDRMEGAASGTTYAYARGDGSDAVLDGGGEDTLAFGAGLDAGDVLLSRQGNHLRVAIAGTVDGLTVEEHFLPPNPYYPGTGYAVERMTFADGTEWNRTALEARLAAGNVNRFSEGADAIVGTVGADSLDGLGGDDALCGLDGADVLEGGAGADQLFGNAGDDLLSGGADNDRLFGGDGADRLDGGAGDDMLGGGAGGDTYLFGRGSGADRIDATAGGGAAANVVEILPGAVPADLVVSRDYSYLSLRIADSGDQLLIFGFFDAASPERIEEIRFADGTVWARAEIEAMAQSIHGTEADDTLHGDEFDNVLLGLGGNDALWGDNGNDRLDGGSGADALRGDGGDDTYVVDNPADTTTEGTGQGNDTVLAAVSWTLGANIENLALSGDAAIDGTGNGLANTLIGNAAANTLSGSGGADTMRGGAGGDTYLVDNAGDSVVELAGEGVDLVKSSVTFTLGAELENLILTGSSAIHGTGNGLANALTGNGAGNTLAGGAGDDRLDGKGGADTLRGGAGNDTYAVDNSGDAVAENAGEGIDTVTASRTWTLGASLENLVLSGTGSFSGTGNALPNLLRGNGAANTLTGGAGIDLLEGGAGNDTLNDSASAERGFFNGGAGADKLNGGAGAECFVGGSGNDTLSTGAGADLIVFNLGDGQDAVTSAAGQDNTLCLGGGIRYADVSLSKSSADLVVSVGASDRITLKNWYAATAVKSVHTLQMVAEAMADFDDLGADPLRDDRIECFDFAGLVGAFDAARAANPGLSTWAVASALPGFHLSGSDGAALGGDLAFQYGRHGGLANVGLVGAQNVLGSDLFGLQAQALQNPAGLMEGVMILT